MRRRSDHFLANFIMTSAMLGFTACTTTQNKNWDTTRASEEFNNEKKIHKARMDERDFCWKVGLHTFLTNVDVKPSLGCIYPSSEMVVRNEGLIFIDRVYGQLIKALKIRQVTPDGFIVESSYAGQVVQGSYTDNYCPVGSIIFIHKTNESGLVDGSYLDEAQDMKMYEYSGPYSYVTLTGSKTVHSFKRIPSEKFVNARKELKIYDPIKEFYGENQLWEKFESIEKGKPAN